MFQAPPRRDTVSPVEPEGGPVDGEHGIPDNPNGPTPNGVGQICIPCPKLRGSNPPPAAFGGHPRQRGTEEAGRIHPRRGGHKRREESTPVAGDRRGGKNPPPATRACSCSPKGATENSPGFGPEISGAPRVSPFGTEFVPGATTCPRSNRMGSHGGLPLQGEADGQSRISARPTTPPRARFSQDWPRLLPVIRPVPSTRGY